jgi:putative DNA primase/helicase
MPTQERRADGARQSEKKPLHSDDNMLSTALQAAEGVRWAGCWATANGIFDADPVRRSGAFADFAKDVAVGHNLTTKDGPGIIGAELGDFREKVSLRCNANVLGVHILGFDFDHMEPEDAEKALSCFQGKLYLAYSSFSHGKPDPETGRPDTRFRLFLPLKRPVSVDEHRVLWRAFHDPLSGSLSQGPDVGARAASNYFHGFRGVNPEALLPRWFTVADGDPLDPDEYLLASAVKASLDRAKITVDIRPDTRQKAYSDAALRSACDLISSMKTGGRHAELLKQARSIGGLLWTGLSFEEAHEALKQSGLAAGLSETEADRTARAGLEFGQEDPREIPMKPLEARLSELAALTVPEYEAIRKEASSELNIRAGVLDKLIADRRKQATADDKQDLFPAVEPWPDPVNGEEVLDDALAIFERFVVADIETLLAATVWSALTWFADFATVLPIVVISAPEKGCGKTVLLSVISELVQRPLCSSNISASSLFRSIEEWAPTLLVDEADSFIKDNEDLRGLLNCGHTRKTAYVVRSEERDGKWKPVLFTTWAPKALTGIALDRTLPDTILSRSILLPLRRKTQAEKVEIFRHAKDEVFEPVRRKLARWAADNGPKFGDTRPLMETLFNRNADNWEPLVALSSVAGGKWSARIQSVIQKFLGAEESPSLNETLLADIQEIFQSKGVTKVSTADMIAALCSDDERPWGTYNKGFPIKPNQLSRRLKGFGIHPKSIRVSASDTPKGYCVADFGESFRRYLHPSKKGKTSATTATTANEAGNEGFQTATTPAPVADKKILKQASKADVSDVADKTPKKEGVPDGYVTRSF